MRADYYHNERYYRAHRRAARAYQRRHKEQGLCVTCCEPAVTADYCETHRRAINVSSLKRYYEKVRPLREIAA